MSPLVILLCVAAVCAAILAQPIVCVVALAAAVVTALVAA